MCSKFASTSDPGQSPAGCWLVRDGKVLASVEIPRTKRAKAKGLLGREELDGAMLIRPARSVHTIGMKFELDVALLDETGKVIKTLHLRKGRVSAPILRARAVLEAQAGAFSTWGLRIGDVLEIRGSDSSEEQPEPAK